MFSIRSPFVFLALLICFVLPNLLHAADNEASWQVKELRCEYSVDPLGIDVPEPRLFWQLVGAKRGQRQNGLSSPRCQLARSLEPRPG